MQMPDELTTSNTYMNYDEIPPLPANVDQQELLNYMHQKFQSKNWIDNIEAITFLRQINKSYPDSMNQVCEIFWSFILQALENPKTAVCKNMLVFLQEVFVKVNSGLNDVIIQTTASSVILKTQHTSSVIKTEAQKAFELLTSYCVKESLIVALSGVCGDKNPKVAELAFKALEKVLGSVVQHIMQAQADTFKAIFAACKIALTGKRTELKKHAEVIVKGIYEVIGDANFNQLIQMLVGGGILEEKDLENIKQSFGSGTTNKTPRLGEVLSWQRKLASSEIPGRL